jgi:PAS domain S-box-containing protein/putative nucleotidyltransferase with HDIG domain
MVHMDPRDASPSRGSRFGGLPAEPTISSAKDLIAGADADYGSVAEMKFAAAFASSTDAIHISRVCDGMLVEVNDRFHELTGHSVSDVLDGRLFEIGIWENHADRSRLADDLAVKGHVSGFETAVRHKNGSARMVSISARMIELAGEPHILAVTRDISDHVRVEQELAASNARLGRMIGDMTTTLGRIVESRDPYTHGHQERVAEIAVVIARAMGLPEYCVEAVRMAALVHDVGKLSVPSEILSRPGKLSDVEFDLIRTHSDAGHSILSGIDFDWPMADIVRQHHERCDGSGYPYGLVGEQILLPARILAIADVVEAMASHRPYRPALGLAAAIAEIEDQPEKYDPRAREACLRLHAEGGLDFITAQRAQCGHA